MRIHLFRQPIFYFARRLIHPALNRMGINNNRMDTYNNLWNITTDITRNGGFTASLYTTWQLRRLLQGRINPDRFNNVVRNYINLDPQGNNNMIDLFNRLTNSSYSDILPFIRQVNYMIASIIGNISLLFIKTLLKSTLLGALTTIFTCLASTIGILWIPSLADISSFLNFALRVKSFVDNLLPGNLSLPIPQWLKDKIKLDIWNKSLKLFNLPFLKYIFPIMGSQLFDWFSFEWLTNLLNHILPFDINILSFLFRPLKAFIFWSGWYYLNKLLVYDIEGNFASVKWHKLNDLYNYLFNKSNRIDSNLISIIKKDIELYRFIQRVLTYLFDEFNLFYVYFVFN